MVNNIVPMPGYVHLYRSMLRFYDMPSAELKEMLYLLLSLIHILDEDEFEDDGYGEDDETNEAYGEPDYLTEDDFDDKGSK